MSKALCFKNLQDFNLLAEGKVPTIDFQMVDRSICEVADSGWIQMLPYVSFSYLDAEEGKLNFAAYRRPGSGEGESRLQGKFSVGFGGHIDLDEEVYHTDKVTTESGDEIYKLTLEDIKSTAITCVVRELKEELGFNPFEVLQINDSNVLFGLEREAEPDEVGSLHLCLSIKVNLDAERFTDLLTKATPNEAEIEDFRGMAVDIKSYITSFNIPMAANSLVGNLDEIGAESWTKLVILSTITVLVAFIQYNFNLKDVIDTIGKKAEDAEQAARAERDAADAAKSAEIVAAEAAKAAEATQTELIVDSMSAPQSTLVQSGEVTDVTDISGHAV